MHRAVSVLLISVLVGVLPAAARAAAPGDILLADRNHEQGADTDGDGAPEYTGGPFLFPAAGTGNGGLDGGVRLFSAADFGGSADIAAEPSGTFVSVDYGQVRRFDIAGDQPAFQVDPVSIGGELQGLAGVTVTPDGQIFTVDQTDGQLIRIDANGNQAVIADGLDEPTGMAVGPDGAIAIAEARGNQPGRITKVVPGTGAKTVVAAGLPLVDPYELAFLPNGRLAIADPSYADQYKGAVAIIDPTQPTPLAGAEVVPFADTNLARVLSIGVEGSGALVVAGFFETSPYPPGALRNAGLFRITDRQAPTLQLIGGDIGAPGGMVVLPAAPDVVITAGPTGATNQRRPSFAFSAAGATFTCRIDQAAATPCTSPFQPAANLSEAAHTFTVSATRGGVSATASRNFSVDVTPPTTTISSGPAEGATVNTRSPQFTFSSNETGVAYICEINGGPGVSCAATYAPPALADGDYTLTVHAVDAAGNADATPASRSFTVDATQPDTFIAGPSGRIADATPTFTFTSDKAGTTFRCTLDVETVTAASPACAASFTTATLPEGAHVIRGAALDGAGNLDPTPAASGFVVDQTPPHTTISAGPPSRTSDTTPAFTFAATDTPLGPNNPLTYMCTLDNAATTCSSGAALPAVAQGSHTFAVRATDAAGNQETVAATRTFVVDTTPPDTTITSGPTGRTADGTPTFEFSATDTPAGGGNPVTFACAVDGAPVACASGLPLAAVPDGPHTLTVRATDAAGNTESAAGAASRDFVVDTTPPSPSITGGPAARTSDTTPTFTFAATDTPAGGGSPTLACTLDGAAGACASGTALPALADGAHRFTVQATDDVGNVSAPVVRDFVVDTTPPDTTFSSGPDGRTSDSTPAFAFGATDAPAGPGNPLTYVCTLDEAPIACASGSSLPALADGQHVLRVRATDAAGNAEAAADAASRVFLVDTTPPDSTIAGPDGIVTTATPTFALTATDAPAGGDNPLSFRCALDDGAESPCPASFTTPALGDGPHVLRVRAVDAVANIEPADGASERRFEVRTGSTGGPPPGDDGGAPPTDGGTSPAPGSPPSGGGGAAPPAGSPSGGTTPGTEGSSRPGSALTATVRRTVGRAAFLRDGLRISVGCAATCKVAAKLTIRARGRTTTVASFGGRLPAGGRKVVLKPTRAGRRLLAARRGSQKAVLEVRAGGTTITRRVTVSAAP